ncbi:Ig-like domain-containing protein [Aestuariibacter halophilus]|uniref:Ig-like domain-containing protein n=1 Tax=Fluctibacter halophilus TaxID=226011 RepID=A0ABS8G6M6_9ALTE|nr:Ig-like domain-containing protein [Aestuariibacter halophilus]MCC2614866.1 Ig-like domain-containing protein [Aestuariibacter halophilus]
MLGWLMCTGTLYAQSTSQAQIGWHKHPTPHTFEDVALSREAHDALLDDSDGQDFWGNMGPNAVFRAWTSAAFSPSQQRFYFFGGGHSDYGGNEIYTFDVSNGSWARLTDPAPLVKPEAHSQKANTTVYLPENSPMSTHTYDGVVWNPTTQSIWTSSPHGFGGGGGVPPHAPETPVMWEFKTATNTWHQYPASVNFHYPMSAYLAERNQALFIGHVNKKHVAALYDTDGKETWLGEVIGLDAPGLSSLFVHPQTGQLYSAHKYAIYRLDWQGNTLSATKVVEFPALEDLHFTNFFAQAAINFRPVDGKFYFWNGGPEIMTWDPQSLDFEVIWNEQDTDTPLRDAQGANKVFSKFTYVEQGDYFVGLQNAGDNQGSDGVWYWYPRSNPDDINVLTPQTLQADGVTQTSASLLLPAKQDKNFNATVRIDIKAQGQDQWQRAIDLFRMRPDMVRNSKNSTELSPDGFAGIITGLTPDTQYTVRATVQDPDATTEYDVQEITLRTSAMPGTQGQLRQIVIANDSELQSALNQAEPGDTFVLSPGLYGPITLKQSGTAAHPVTVTGASLGNVLINADGQGVGVDIDASYVRIHNLSITNAGKGVRLSSDTQGVVIDSNLINQVNVGIDAKGGHQDLTIINNRLTGPHAFGNLSNETWNHEGIVVTGHNIEVAHNTLAGFGDSLGLHWNTQRANVAINIHHNLINWGGDDGIEFDFALRNVAVHHNLITNTANGLSFQPVWGGPVYAYRNVVLNAARGPLKIKPEQDNPSGMLIYHNTLVTRDSDVGTGEAWKNSSGDIRLLTINNNLFVSGAGSSEFTLKNTSAHSYVNLDYNGWTQDGKFTFDLASQRYAVSVDSFAQWQQGPLGNHDRLLDSDTLFADSLSLQRFDDYLSTSTDVRLNSASMAIDGGIAIPGINDAYQGNAPDLGAYEAGQPLPVYGAQLTVAEDQVLIALPDHVSVQKGQRVAIAPLLNDIHRQGRALNLTAIETPKRGTLTMTGNFGFYTADSSFEGSLRLAYTVSDNRGQQDNSEIVITITGDNQPPVAVNDTVELMGLNEHTFDVTLLLANDRDPDDDPLTLQNIQMPTRGTLSLINQTLVYRPDNNRFGDERVSYTITDGRGGEASAFLTLSVVADNHVKGTEYRDSIDLSDSTFGFTLEGLDGHDYLVGSQGKDRIDGGDGSDVVDAQGGDDYILFAGTTMGFDNIDGGDGYDQILGTEGDDTLSIDSLVNVEKIDAKGGYDILLGDNYRQQFDFRKTVLRGIELIDLAGGHDQFIGSAQWDKVLPGEGNDSIDGQAGQDTVYYRYNAADYVIEYQHDGSWLVTALKGDEGQDTLIRIEYLHFSDGKRPL